MLLLVAAGCGSPLDLDQGAPGSASSDDGDHDDGDETVPGNACSSVSTDGQELCDEVLSGDIEIVPSDDDPIDIEDEPLLMGLAGDADVLSGGFEGAEDLYFATDNGLGEDVCRITYKLSATGLRDDCEDCDWAFDLVASEPEIVVGTAEDCAALGYDDEAIQQWLEQPRAYGYVTEYFGHADVLLVLDAEGRWDAVSFADWTPDAGVLAYDWEIDYVTP